MDFKVVKGSFCRIPISSLIVMLYNYPMVIDYILEIKLTKRQNIKNGFIHFSSPI